MRVLSSLPPKAGMTVKTVAKTATATSSAIRKVGSKIALATCSDMLGFPCAQTSKFIIFFITKIPIAIQISETPRIRWPVLVTKSGMM